MDEATAKEIAEAFVATVETNLPAPSFADDVFCDINVPEWRFQMMGLAAIGDWLRSEQPDGCKVSTWSFEPTASGVLVEVEQHLGEDISRNLHRLEVRDGKIVAWTMYCTGVWSPEVQERQRREAPMFRA